MPPTGPGQNMQATAPARRRAPTKLSERLSPRAAIAAIVALSLGFWWLAAAIVDAVLKKLF